MIVVFMVNPQFLLRCLQKFSFLGFYGLDALNRREIFWHCTSNALNCFADLFAYLMMCSIGVGLAMYVLFPNLLFSLSGAEEIGC